MTFFAHVEEDADVALEIALGLEEAGYTTWIYEVDSIPGPSYLIQTGKAVEVSKAVVVVISPHSVGSRQVTKEIVRAHESSKEFIPILRGITHVEFQNRQPEWREAVGAAASTSIPREGVAPILPRIISGLGILGIAPGTKRDTAKIIQIRRVLGDLRGHAVTETPVEQPLPAKKPAPVKMPARAGKGIARTFCLGAGIILTVGGLGVAWLFTLIWSGAFGFPVEEDPWYRLFLFILLFGLPGVIPGVYLTRRGIAGYLRNKPVSGRVSNWWWLLPVALGFIGGIISWVKHKNVNWRQARNMLTVGTLVTFVFTIPLLAGNVSPAPPPSTPSIPSTQAVTQEPTKLFYDDFESGKLTSWQVASNGGEAKVNLKEGKYFLELRGDVNCLTGSPSWTDYTIKLKVLLLEGQPIIRFRQFPVATGQGGIAKSYVVMLTQDTCSLQKAYYEGSVLPQNLAYVPVQIKPDTWQDVFIICQGNKVAVGLGNATILDYVDNQEPILSGANALGNQGNSYVVFDDIFVEGRTEDIQITQTAPPAPAAPPSSPPTTSVVFPDGNLNKAIRNALGKQPGDSITEAELAKLTRLDASQMGISDLTGINYLVNLTELFLFSNQISHVSALSSLTKLNSLHLYGNKISNIQPLSTLTNLGKLTLDGNKISDIRPLSSLVNLSILHLSGNQISNIYSLSSFTKLTSLYLHGNQITDIQPLTTNSGLSAGDIVTLQGNPLSSTSINDYVPQLEKKDVIVLVDSTPQDVYWNDFSKDSGGWPDISNEQYEVSYKDGEYYFTEKKRGLSFLSNQSAGKFADFILDADVRLISGPNQNAFGMIFRVLDTQQDFYFFKVTANGYYVVGKRVNGIPQVIVNKGSEYLQKDYNTNHLTVVCKGSKIVVYVNWNYLTTITDDSFTKGYIGVSIGPGTSALATTVAFDNIRIKDIPTPFP